MRYRNIGALLIPADFSIPTCGRCAAEFLNAATCDQLAPLLLKAYQAVLCGVASKLVPAATANLSQRRLEILLGLSQGYLSRIKSRSGQPSSILVALLHLLTQPGTAAELERFFAFLGSLG
jgi:hypothetical protein